MQTIESIWFGTTNYPLRIVTINGYGEQYIAPISLENKLLNKDEEYVSDFAREVDEMIFYYIDDSLIAEASDEELKVKVEYELGIGDEDNDMG